MHEMILCKLGEVVLKGLNRRSFEDKLMANVNRRVAKCGNFRIYAKQSTIYVEPKDENCDIDAAFEGCKKVFGIIAVSKALPCEKDIQKQRFSGTNITCNTQMTPAMVGEFCTLDAAGEKLLKGAFERLGLTARSHDRLLRVARTIADLDGSETIEAHHLAEAIQYRNTDILQG